MALKLVRRSSFGWGSSAAGYGPCRNGLVVHYDGNNQGLARKAHSACVTYWKNTRRFHMGPKRGWADIGYSYGVCPHGYAFEGRGWQKQQAAQPGGNSTWTSVTFMSGDAEAPTAAQLQAFRDLRAYLRGKGLASRIKGHRNFVSTSCPGGKLYALVTNTRSALYAGGGSTGGSTSKTTEDLVKALPMLAKGAKASNEHVQTARGLLLARSHPEIGKVEGAFDAKMEAAVKAVQRWGKVDDDGIIGPITWSVLLRVH